MIRFETKNNLKKCLFELCLKISDQWRNVRQQKTKGLRDVINAYFVLQCYFKESIYRVVPQNCPYNTIAMDIFQHDWNCLIASMLYTSFLLSLSRFCQSEDHLSKVLTLQRVEERRKQSVHDTPTHQLVLCIQIKGVLHLLPQN